MNTLQKTLLSAATILSFGFYTVFLRAQDSQLIAIVPSAGAADTVQQNPADISAPPPPTELKTYIDQINAEAAKNQVAQTQQTAAQTQTVQTEARQQATAQADAQATQQQIAAQAQVAAQITAQQQAAQLAVQEQASAQAQAQQQAAQRAAQQQAAAQAQAAAQSGQYKNGTYTGQSVNVYYGNVQVQAVIQGGQIADVLFLQYPSDRSTSRSINGQAMPLLKQEAIQAQSANVNGVSGASATSQGFVQSLSDALSQARV